jgi:hypothetical protein
MKKWGLPVILLGGLMFVLISCERFDPAGGKELSGGSAAASDTIPLADSILLLALPAEAAGFSYSEDERNAFHSGNLQFTEVRRTFFSARRETYLSIILQDYSGDLPGFERIREEFESGEDAGKLRITDLHRLKIRRKDAFACSYALPFREGIILEAGIGGRYHLFMRTNLPSGRKRLESVFREMLAGGLLLDRNAFRESASERQVRAQGSSLP